ncbi:hypothetical protein F4813DRAFT_193488 [Daldinia decipiens]|uniref:uncharacterized protein n=1 Tax=Daldinia decipiens TaxID=326647 RepID=UPI0020C4F05A|nr:uncharacterized protein F4813DRAFT_193488 [Daldinia decipiens]KAI1654982.1 hypothetical protein F4813DRAFT_193488 [Daldinia decipiens]
MEPHGNFSVATSYYMYVCILVVGMYLPRWLEQDGLKRPWKNTKTRRIILKPRSILFIDFLLLLVSAQRMLAYYLHSRGSFLLSLFPLRRLSTILGLILHNGTDRSSFYFLTSLFLTLILSPL